MGLRYNKNLHMFFSTPEPSALPSEQYLKTANRYHDLVVGEPTRIPTVYLSAFKALWCLLFAIYHRQKGN